MDRTEFDEFHRRSAPGTGRLLLLLTGDEELAAELVEEVYGQLWEAGTRGRAPLSATWVRARAAHLALDPWQRLLARLVRTGRGRTRPVPPAEPAGPPDPTEREAREVLAAVAQLPPHHRLTLLLHDVLELDPADVAAETEATAVATASRLRRARIALLAEVPRVAGVPGDAVRLALDPEVGRRIGAALRTAAARVPVRAVEPESARARGARHEALVTKAALGVTVTVTGLTLLAWLLSDLVAGTTGPAG